MRRRLVVAVVLPALLPLLGACASATVVSDEPGAVVFRWDENVVSRSKVVNQAASLCGDNGYSARRAIAVADTKEGSVHTTRYACRPIGNGT